MPRQRRESDQQAEQVGDDDPLVLQMREQTGQSGSFAESGDEEPVRRDHEQAGKRDRERVPVQQRNAEQRRAEQQELDADAAQRWRAVAGGECAARAAEEQQRADAADQPRSAR
jgi:hypothetical protein